MFKYVFVLCLMIFATLYTLGGRESGPVRDGLAGKIAPLALPRDETRADPETRQAAAEAPRPAPATAVVREASQARPAPQPVAEPAATGGVIAAAFVADGTEAGETDAGLTLALPLVRPEEPGPTLPVAAEDPAPQADPPVAEVAEPVVQYVTASTVNVRAGPSAETESLLKLTRGEAVLAEPSDTPGWSRIRIEGDGVEGFIASRFLGDPPQDGLFGATD